MSKNGNTRFKILVVEDYNDTRVMLRTALEQAGYRVIEAATGAEAVEAAARDHPDLILMDLNLPVFDGITATDLIRNYKELKDVPVVAMTAFDSADFRTDAAGVGCHGYLTKPIDLDELRDLLNRLLHRREAAKQ